MHRKVDDEQLKDLLSQMPKVRDERSAHEIYSNIIDKVETKPNRIRWIPSIAVAVSILLFAAISPVIFQQLSSGERDIATEMLIDRGAEEHISEDIDTGDHAMRITEEGINGEEEMVGITSFDYIPSNVVSEVSDNEFIITVAVSTIPTNGGEDPFTVPLSFVTPHNGKTYMEVYTEVVEQLPQRVSLEGLGVVNTLLKDIVNIKEEDNGSASNVIIDLDSSFRAYSSIETIVFFKEVMETFRWSNLFTDIEYYTEGTKGVELGNDYKETDPIVKFAQKAFLKYQYNDSNQALLIPTKESFETMIEAVKVMSQKQAEAYVYPLLNEEIVIEQIVENGEEVTVTFSDNTILENNQESLLALEGLLLTARDFGYKYVTFESISTDVVGSITMNTRTPVPLAPNPIY